MHITIIGAGRMGTWFTRYFLRQRHNVYVHDVNKDALKRLPSNANIISNMKQTLMDSDVVMVCVPIAMTKKILLQVSKYMMINSTLIEIASIKHESHKVLAEVARMYKLTPLSLHPLFGPGADSIKGRKIAIIPVFNPKKESMMAKNLFNGASLIHVDVDEHDKIMAVVLGLTHLSNFIIANTLANEKNYSRMKEIGGTTFTIQSMLMESVLNDDPSLSVALISSNPYTKRYARSFLEAAGKFCNYVLNDNQKGLMNTCIKTKEKFADRDLEGSYRMMYEILQKFTGK